MKYQLVDFFSVKSQNLVEALRYGELYAYSCNHDNITIEHIVMGYLIYLNNLDNDEFVDIVMAFPTIENWFISPQEYSEEKAISLKSDNCFNSESKPRLDKSIKDFKDKIIKNCVIGNWDNFEVFYILLLYFVYKHSLGKRYYIPSGNIISILNFSNVEKMYYSYKDYVKSKILFKKKILKLRSNYTYFPIDKNIISLKSTVFSSPIKVNYTTDLTYLAYSGKLSNVIGREKEIDRMIDILCKKNKNNPVLIGNPGVGKTALIDALAIKILQNDVPEKIKNHHILMLDIVSALAGTRYRGDFEERIKNLMDEIIFYIDDGNEIIIYIDEIHTIVGMGATGTDGALDFSNILKPYLLNPKIKIIGTSTLNEYRNIESDKALERRFDTIYVKEPSFDETLEILNGIKASFEDFHKVFISKAVLEAVIKLSKRYIPERFLPDKAIDLLDETCTIVKNHHDNANEVTLDDVFMAVSIKKKIPIEKIHDNCDFMNLEKNLNSRVVGQKHVFSIIAQAIKRSKAGLNDPNRPLASFLFVGPTGVGKTETAKALADFVFSGKDNIIRFDMSEFMEEQAVSKLIGAPPGYVGYDEPGQLTEQVRRNPYSLILFDEIEKAHQKIYNILLQILDEGCLTDSKGEHINFKNTIIILTSNVGVKALSKNSVGFGEQSCSKGKDVMDEVKKHFSPEFLNRLDEIILFNNLSEEDIFQITKLQIFDFIKKVKESNLNISISDTVISRIAEIGYNSEYGVRELNRTIDREIKNPLADYILQHDANSIMIDFINDKINITHKEMCTTF